MALEIHRFAALNPGQIFLSKNGNMYRKSDEESAELIRLPSGKEPDETTLDRFPPNESVELVPTSENWET